jgi:predicted enzyme related to lactoylglutathione lyase
MEGKVIGIGGIFIKCQNPDLMKQWYANALGLIINDYGVLFKFNHKEQPRPGLLQLGTFEEDTTYFGSKTQRYMLNFRVDNLELLKKKLDDLGTTILGPIETYDYGKFLHVKDPEGNKIELWEPINSPFQNEACQEMA